MDARLITQQTTTVLASSYTGMSNITTNTSYPITNAYTDTSSTTYAQLTASKKNGTSAIYFTGFDFSAIPSSATINSVTIKVKAMVSSTSYITSATMQASSNTTVRGSSINFRSITATVYTADAGTWTRSELSNFRIYLTAKKSNVNNTAYARIYGIEVIVDWSVYESDDTYYIQLNNAPVQVQAVYKKINGSWVEQGTVDIDSTTNLLYKGGI